MQQSNVIFAALFIAFLVYIVTKGELSTYIGFLKGSTNAQSSTPVTTTSTSAIKLPPAPNFASSNSVEQSAMQLLSQSPGIQIPAPAPQ